MAERPVNPEIAADLLRILRDHLAGDPQARALLDRYEQGSQQAGAELVDYLRRRPDAGHALAKSLSALPGLPPSVRTDVWGGHIEKLFQFAQVGTVQVAVDKVEVVLPPPAPRGRRFWLALAAAAVLVAGGLILAWQLFVQIRPMPAKSFNVAVAEFATLDAGGRPVSTDIGRQVSLWLYKAIKKGADQFDPALPVEVWGPEDGVGIVPGADHDARSANAAQVAGRRNFTVFIYGVVTAGDDGYQVEPEFYVSEEGFNYGCEVAGPERLGRPVPLTLPFQPDTQMALNQKLNDRSHVMQHLVWGLAWFYGGRSDRAWTEFNDALSVEGWGPGEGQEVVYLLVGAAKLSLYDQDRDPAQLSQASDAFAHAYQLNPTYARAYLGLGDVALQQARLAGAGKCGDAEKLAEAAGWYSASLSAADQPVTAYVPAKAAFGLARAHRLGYECGLSGWSASQARGFLDQVISTYGAHPEPDLAWLVGHAHAERGRLAGLVGDWPAMSSEYRQAADILAALPGNPPTYWVARYWAQVAYAMERLNQPDAACDAYTKAIGNGSKVVGSGAKAVSPQELDEWKAALDRLRKGAS